jgi:hypothetical protein
MYVRRFIAGGLIAAGAVLGGISYVHFDRDLAAQQKQVTEQISPYFITLQRAEPDSVAYNHAVEAVRELRADMPTETNDRSIGELTLALTLGVLGLVTAEAGMKKKTTEMQVDSA